jgi:predicted PurR-regulated permease PerM
MDSYFSRPFTFDRVVRLIIAFAMSFLLFFMLRYLSGVLLPFCIAWLLAYILYPLVEWVQRFVKYKVLAIFLVLLGIISTIVSFFFFLVPTFIDEFIRFKNILVAQWGNTEWFYTTILGRLDASLFESDRYKGNAKPAEIAGGVQNCFPSCLVALLRLS